MLVLSRKKLERIHIGNHIVISIAAIRGDKVRIGIEAPKEIRIFREELLDGTRQTHRKGSE